MEAVEDVPKSRLAIRELEHGIVTTEAIDQFLTRHEFPLVEGSSVTFVWRGDATGVQLRHWIYGLPTTQPFRRLGPTDLWYLVVELPPNSRVEYKLEIQHGPLSQLIEDPRNDRRAKDPFGANSVFHTTGYELPDWTREDPESRRGRLEEISVPSQALGGDRPVTLYYPALYRESRRYPLLVVHDGPDYLRFADLQTVLDNLTHRLEIPGLMVAMIASPNRLEEYANHEAHSRFVAEELVDHLEKELPLEGHRRGRCLMGASFGAVASFSTASRYPDRFGGLLLQSGSFAFSDVGGAHERGPAFDPVVEFMSAYRDDPFRLADRVFVSCGTYESLIYENRSLVPLLQAQGMDVRFVEARDGHNWENWRDRLREGLSWLFPGPLWMVYE